MKPKCFCCSVFRVLLLFFFLFGLVLLLFFVHFCYFIMACGSLKFSVKTGKEVLKKRPTNLILLGVPISTEWYRVSLIDCDNGPRPLFTLRFRWQHGCRVLWMKSGRVLFYEWTNEQFIISWEYYVVVWSNNTAGHWQLGDVSPCL